MGRVQDKVCLVTGGGSGIGRCTAHELVSLGARVALVGRKIEKLQAVQAEIQALGRQLGQQPLKAVNAHQLHARGQRAQRHLPQVLPGIALHVATFAHETDHGHGAAGGEPSHCEGQGCVL